MIKLKSSVKELLKAVCSDERIVAECIDTAQKGLITRYYFSLPIPTKFGVPITVKLTREEDCVIVPDYNKWYDREYFDKCAFPENSAIIEFTDNGYLFSEESVNLHELNFNTVKFMVIDLKGVLD